EKKGPKEKKSYDTAVITVSSGEGIDKLFKSIGATHIIAGGQTMNPSTEDILKTIEGEDVKKVIILPNNKNIIMAAEQARDMLDIPAIVIPTTSIPEGLAGLLSYSPEAELQDNQEAMQEPLEYVKTGKVTYAVHDIQTERTKSKKRQHNGIYECKNTAANESREETLKALIESMLDDDSEIVTILIGQEGSREETDRIVESIEAEYDEVEFEVH